MNRRSLLPLLGGFGIRCYAQDWPQWRGPKRDGVAPPAGAEPWPAKLTRAWTAKVGEGHSSPVVSGTRVFQFSREGENEITRALDLESGKEVWRHSYPAPYRINPAAHAHGKGPKSTPAVAGATVFTLGMNGTALALNAASGKPVWRYESSGKFSQTSPLFGVAASPIVDGGQVILYVGTDSDGSLTSMDVQSGAVRWQWKGDGPGYGSPVIVEIGGIRQLVVFSASNLVGVSAADGKLLWKLPFTTPYAQNSVTPLVIGDTIIYSGLQNPVTAIRVSAGAPPAKLWDNKEVGLYMNSPVLSAGLVIGLSHRNKGQYFALDPKTGKTVWTGEGRQGENAMLVALGSTVLSLTTEGELHVFRASSRGLQPAFKHTVAQSATWAHPAISGSRLLIKDVDTLSMWRAG